ncbi:hypothetical protein RB195_007121 [Necator americanus]|uniref:Uncharacterized protein n=1 Tax=Necator americanus TaxID=51031 RepID=A0ABR1BVP5_NECAM
MANILSTNCQDIRLMMSRKFHRQAEDVERWAAPTTEMDPPDGPKQDARPMGPTYKQPVQQITTDEYESALER